MEFLVNNWGYLLIVLAIALGLVDLVRNDKEKAKKWLLFAVLEAEKEFGSKTGAIKLRYVYEMFVKTFPMLAKFTSFEEFSKMVDLSLDEMKHLIDTNVKVFEYVGGAEVVKL